MDDDGGLGAERFETVIIGGGQAGLAVGRQLARRDRPFVILDAGQRVGDSWHHRWDSLRLFTPARYDALPGLRFPAPGHSAPTKDQMADYLATYAEHFRLPIRTGVRVDGVSREGNRYVLTAGGRRLEAEQVVVATGGFKDPKIPPFAGELDPGIVQLHSVAYRRPSQFQEGGVLVVGAGNSGAEIALEASRHHPTWLSGRHPGHVPFRIDGVTGRFLVRGVKFVGHHVLTLGTPVGRKVRPRFVSRGNPLVRTKPKDIAAARIERVPRVGGVRDGLPVLEDGRVLEVANVVWCTGFRPDFSWIDLPVLGENGEPVHQRGTVANEPGLYFVGLEFLYAATSGVVVGVGRDAEHIAKRIAARAPGGRLTAGVEAGAAA
jgi:putative flavoprotein involved in K+ transport